ncbi:hypothetical protein AURDEDRAFT_170857 [Auricularia subglabra TFB-10046 SS5]|nr:hypothetical protein AURDEDRAFT_170857 [Auricularia subglabra TFB-10046 SS5]
MSSASPSRTTPQRVLHRAAPGPCSLPVDQIFPLYRDLVWERSVLFVQLEPRVWAAQLYDFDKDERHRGVHGWTVFVAEPELDGSVKYSCSPCADYKAHKDCVHVRVVEDKDAPSWIILSEEYGAEVVPLEGCSSEENGEPQWTFACLDREKQPVFVCHIGESIAKGTWACSKHRGASCYHVAHVRERVRDLENEQGHENPLDEDDDDNEADEAAVEELLPADRAKAEEKAEESRQKERSVSDLPVSPPKWCRIDSDAAIEWFPLVDPLPDVLPLNTAGRCTCGAVASLDTSTRLLPCTVFGSHRSYSRMIEVRRHPTGPLSGITPPHLR